MKIICVSKLTKTDKGLLQLLEIDAQIRFLFSSRNAKSSDKSHISYILIYRWNTPQRFPKYRRKVLEFKDLSLRLLNYSKFSKLNTSIRES